MFVFELQNIVHSLSNFFFRWKIVDSVMDAISNWSAEVSLCVEMKAVFSGFVWIFFFSCHHDTVYIKTSPKRRDNWKQFLRLLLWPGWPDRLVWNLKFWIFSSNYFTASFGMYLNPSRILDCVYLVQMPIFRLVRYSRKLSMALHK